MDIANVRTRECAVAAANSRATITSQISNQKSEIRNRLLMFATIYLPNFYLQAALRHQALLPITPVGVIDEKDKKATIIQLNRAAETAGIRKGMTPSQGLARSLSLVIKTRSHSQEKLIGQIVLHYAFTLSPYVEATGPGVCTVQFTKWHRHPLARRSGAKAA